MFKAKYGLLIAVLFCSVFGVTAADDAQIDVGAFVTELMKYQFGSPDNQIALWLPHDFIVAAALLEGGVTKTELENDLEFLEPYQTVVVQTSIDQPDGSSTYSSEASIRKRASILLANGKSVQPLEKVPPMVSATIAAMKAMFASEGDAGGENMHVLIFPSTVDGKPVVKTDSKDSFRVVLKKSASFPRAEFEWKTPFEAATPPAECNKCGEKTSRQWSFCPWCGEKTGR